MHDFWGLEIMNYQGKSFQLNHVGKEALWSLKGMI